MKILIWIVTLLCTFQTSLFALPSDELLDRAQNEVLIAKTASTPQEKQEAINLALKSLLLFEKEGLEETYYAPFLVNIGRLFSALEQHPWAMLYYQRAKRVDHRNPEVDSLIQQTAKKLFLEDEMVRPEENDSWIQRGFTLFSISQWLFSSFVFLILAALFYSIYVWTHQKKFLLIGHFPFTISLFLFSIVSLFYYFSPIEAVMIEASSYYESPNDLAAKVKDFPLLAGESVEVIATKENGLWLQIRTSDGTIAFVPYKKIRLL